MIDTTITISGFQIHEPTTVLTDLIIATLALLFFFKLRKFTDEVVRNWSYFFFFLGLATLIGSTSHAFFAIHEGWKYKSLWLGMQAINGLGIYYAQRATSVSVLKESPSKKIWKLSYDIQLFLFLDALIIFQKYLVSVIENAVGLIPIMILHYKYNRPYARILANGIAISFATAIIYILKLSLHDYFNHNDLAHVIIMISLAVMYKGIHLRAISSDE